MVLNDLITGLHGIISSIGGILESNFTTALVGAFFGAYGGQLIVEKSKNKEELIKEMRNTNAAIMLAFDICNAYMAQRRQHIDSLKAAYDHQRNELLAGNLKSKFIIDGQTLTPMMMPTDALQTQIFEKVSLNGRPLSLTIALLRAINSLNDSLSTRNRLIEAYKQMASGQSGLVTKLYFGLPDDKGHIDISYPNTIDAIYQETKDCIFYSWLLCEDLVGHGKELLKKHPKLLLQVNEVGFDKAKKSGLIPSEDEYTDWLTKFISKKMESRHRFWKIK